jgi:hypothetical protein
MVHEFIFLFFHLLLFLFCLLPTSTSRKNPQMVKPKPKQDEKGNWTHYCRDCKVYLPISFFYESYAARGMPYCKGCHRKRASASRKATKRMRELDDEYEEKKQIANTEKRIQRR